VFDLSISMAFGRDEGTYLGMVERWFESSVHGSIHVRGTTPLF
jgi:hypothetical protein